MNGIAMSCCGLSRFELDFSCLDFRFVVPTVDRNKFDHKIYHGVDDG